MGNFWLLKSPFKSSLNIINFNNFFLCFSWATVCPGVKLLLFLSEPPCVKVEENPAPRKRSSKDEEEKADGIFAHLQGLPLVHAPA